MTLVSHNKWKSIVCMHHTLFCIFVTNVNSLLMISWDLYMMETFIFFVIKLFLLLKCSSNTPMCFLVSVKCVIRVRSASSVPGRNLCSAGALMRPWLLKLIRTFECNWMQVCWRAVFNFQSRLLLFMSGSTWKTPSEGTVIYIYYIYPFWPWIYGTNFITIAVSLLVWTKVLDQLTSNRCET